MDDAAVGIDDVSEEEYNRLKEKSMAHEKVVRPKKPRKAYKSKRGPQYNPEGKKVGLRKGGKA